MFKDTITYVDYNGVTRKEDLYFNINEAEMILLDNSTPGGLHKKLETVANTMDNVQIMDYFMLLIEKSYGVKSDDGKRFVKKPELTEEFKQTEAFNIFFMKLIEDENGFVDRFIAGILPKITEEQVAEAKSKVMEDLKPANIIELPE